MYGIVASQQLVAAPPAPPATETAIGSFLTGTAAATNTVAVTGLGFQPKLILFWWNGSATSGNELATGNLRCGVGYAASTSDRRNIGGQSEHGAATMNTDHQAGDDSCIRVLSTAGALAGALDLQSMDADGFTLVVDTQMAADMRVHFQAFGGADITNVKGGQFDEPATTGDQATTGVGFQPDIVFFLAAPLTGTPPNQGTFNIGSFGVATASGQGVVAWGDENNVATSDTGGYNSSSYCLVRINSTVGSTVARASRTSLDADGFTLNWAERAFTGVHYFFVAVKGGNWGVGQFTTPTDTTTVRTVSGLAFQPKSLLFLGTGGANDLMTSVSSDGGSLSVGLATSSSNRQTVAFNALFNQPNSANALIRRTDSIYATVVHTDPTPTLRALMDLTSVTSDGFTAQMTDAEIGAAQITWVAFG